MDQMLQTAHDRIREVEATNGTSLDLSDLELSELPESIWRLGSLTSLDVSGNQLVSLPESIGELDLLTSLDVSKNQLVSLPESIGGLGSLTTLFVFRNQLVSLPESIGGLGSLTSLDVSGNQLVSLPESIGGLGSLKSLDVSANQLVSLPESIGGLGSLTTLYVYGNQLVTLPESIGGLGSLTSLDVSGNQLVSLPESIGGLDSLTRLDISRNQLVSLPEGIGGLGSLATLSVSGNQLVSLPEGIGGLGSLTTLYVYGNQLVTLPESIGGLGSLTSLDVSGNQLVSLPESIGGLDSLTRLDISRNQLVSLPESIGGLGSLATLSVSGNQLVSLPEGIGGLGSLTSLDVSANQMVLLPEGIGGLGSLTRLDISRNQLVSLPESIGGLGSLTSLDVIANRLVSLPESIGGLGSLATLHAFGNQLVSLPESIGGLGSLATLSVSGNQLVSLPEGIGGLGSLATLSVSGNQLVSLPEGIGGLGSLTFLNLSQNDLRQIPAKCLGKIGSLAELYLHENRHLGVPTEILGSSFSQVHGFENSQLQSEERRKPAPPAKILRYLDKINDGTADRLNEAKLLVVGPGGAGKTSVIEQLIDRKFDKNTKVSTHGIVVRNWADACKSEEEAVSVNVWDFGGQELQHSTHEFFLTERAVYLLVFNPREDQSTQTVLYYWLDLIQMISPDAPIIVALSKQDEFEGLLNDAQELKEKYRIVDYVPISCQEDSEFHKGFDTLRSLIGKEVGTLEHVSNRLPPDWMAVKRDLEKTNEDFLSYDGFQKVCREKEVEEKEDQEMLAGFLHDLGTMLNFSSLMPLEDTSILNPRWVTEGVYALILSSELVASHGIMDEGLVGRLDELLERMLRKEKRLKEGEPYKARYPGSSGRFVLSMMKLFHLCHELTARESGGNTRYLVPNALPQCEPELTQIPEDALRFELRYPRILPSSIIGRFMVHMGSSPEESLLWRQGVAHENWGNPYRVTMHDQEKCIRIAVWGKEEKRVSVIDQIRYSLGMANRVRKGLEYEEWVPIPDHPKIAIKYKMLEKLADEGVTSHFVDGDGDEMIKINPEKLLGRLGEGSEMRSILKKISEADFLAFVEESYPMLLPQFNDSMGYRDKVRLMLEHRDQTRGKEDLFSSLRGTRIEDLIKSTISEDGAKTRRRIRSAEETLKEGQLRTHEKIDERLEEVMNALRQESGDIAKKITQLEEGVEAGFINTQERIDKGFGIVTSLLNDLGAEGPRLIRIEKLPTKFWKPGKVKFQVHVHCEHSGYSVAGLDHMLKLKTEPARGIYEVETSADWLQHAMPVLQIVARLLKGLLSGGETEASLILTVNKSTKGANVAKVRDQVAQKINGYGPKLRELHGFLEKANAKTTDGYGGLIRTIVASGEDEGKYRWVHPTFVDLLDAETGERIYRT